MHKDWNLHVIQDRLPKEDTDLDVRTRMLAEAQAQKIAGTIAKQMHLQDAKFLTDNTILAKAAAGRSPTESPGHWEIRAHLADFCD